MSLSLADELPRVALAFRGFDVTNLGKTADLLKVPVYEPIVAAELERFSAICSDVVGRPVHLERDVRTGVEYELDRYAEAIALIVAVQMAQLRLLKELHHADYRRAQFAFGYSLGEMSALCASSDFSANELIRVPLAMAADCAALARDITMAVVFSRGEAISEEQVARLCLRITAEGKGVVAMSALLSPNTVLLLGQGDAIERFQRARQSTPLAAAHVRINSHRWPPLHTPIVRQRSISDRAAVMLQTTPGGEIPPSPRIFSLVTGKFAYDNSRAREVLRQWIDHPQRLWDAVYVTLAKDVQTVLHIGPAPNLVPATFHRVGENVAQQTTGRSIESYRLRAVTEMVRRPWLASLLPSRAALLRAPYVKHVILEDWLLERAPGRSH